MAEALQTAAAGLTKAGTSVGVLTGGRLPVETCLSWSRFARVVLGTNNVDFRSRPHSAEEAAYLAARVAGTASRNRSPTPTLRRLRG
ncbi:NADH-ubiquinone oxidoreductase [Cutibacterium acnes JCM 18916]|nr:NADH-ubiquinone oxidoreductase [Cutibacterium acnes JCM 18916]